MRKSINKSSKLGKKIFKIIASILLITIITNQMVNIKELQVIEDSGIVHNDKTEKIDETLNIASDNPIIFQGVENPLNITDYGNLYENNQDISFTNETELNLTYYLDDAHEWKISKIENSINEIQDTREWVNNSDFLPVVVFRINSTIESNHDYQSNRNKGNSLNLITETNALAMRAHFDNMTFEDNFDYLFIEDADDTLYYTDTGGRLDFFSPWIPGDTMQFYLESDGLVEEWGYFVDYYEIVNVSSYYTINSDNWDKKNISSTIVNSGPGMSDNATGFFVALYSELSWDGSQYDALIMRMII